MNDEYVQNLREKLNKRFTRLKSTEYWLFHTSLKHFWKFLEDNATYGGILQDLGNLNPSMEAKAEKIINDDQIFNDPESIGDSELERAAISYFLIKKCAESANRNIEIKICENFGKNGAYDPMLAFFNETFLEPLYDYLDEELNDQKAILPLLRRYKHKCEWFQHEHLMDLSEEPHKGESNLANHLYEYLHDQGVDFTIEPHSASGIADLVNQNPDDPLIADAKIFNTEKSKGKQYIINGFNQVYTYTKDFNEPFGYMIIYKTCEKDLKFALTSQTQSVPFVIHNNKTIFFITIDIFDYENTASQRGTLQAVEITEDDLINITEEQGDDIQETVTSEE